VLAVPMKKIVGNMNHFAIIFEDRMIYND